jgi:sugar/nucleoside kinase (ribokinase family)
MLQRAGATIVFANELEAASMGDALLARLASEATVWVKQGSGPAIVHVPGQAAVAVPGIHVADVTDTTGAGDAFAAGVLIAIEAGDAAVQATHRGHELGAAAVALASRTLHAG